MTIDEPGSTEVLGYGSLAIMKLEELKERIASTENETTLAKLKCALAIKEKKYVDVIQYLDLLDD